MAVRKVISSTPYQKYRNIEMACLSSVLMILWTFTSLRSAVVVADTSEVTFHREINPWPPATSVNPSTHDLVREYSSIFKYGNRNAASHRWSTFLLDRSDQMTVERLEFFFSGFCAVSGSPIRPSDYNRYRLTLPSVGMGDVVSGFMHYCCWPCVCDTQDFIRVDTLNVTSSDGISRQRHFAVIGNPCDHPEQLDVPFVQPFGRRTTTTLRDVAREVRCLEGGVLDGATLSDHGYIIIGMFFDAVPAVEDSAQTIETPEPGRMTTVDINGRSILFQDEREWQYQCDDRAAQGYNSGMGEIFRKVSSISPISPQQSLEGQPLQTTLLQKSSSDADHFQSPIATVEEVEPSCDTSKTESMATKI